MSTANNFVDVSEADLALIAEEIKFCWGGVSITHLLSIYTMIYINVKEGGDCTPKTYRTLFHIATSLGFVRETEETNPPKPSDLRNIARHRFLLTDICGYKE